MDTKSFMFFAFMVSAIVFASLAGYGMIFEKLAIGSPKIYTDFIFAGVLAVMSIFVFKIVETSEKV